jgi:hypothetical protein
MNNRTLVADPPIVAGDATSVIGRREATKQKSRHVSALITVRSIPGKRSRSEKT